MNSIDLPTAEPFRLDDAFLEPYRARPVRWGYGALSWVTYKRTYSRDGEDWWQTCRRVIEGTFTVLHAQCAASGRPWSAGKARAIAEDAYRRLWAFQWTPPGRGLWIMGTRFMAEAGGAALNNCGFVSTETIDADFSAPFAWAFDMSMLGVGVGFDTRGKGKGRIVAPARSTEPHVVEDSREGWVAALARTLDAYSGRATLPAAWDLSRIRPRGAPLRRFGGVASGPQPLGELLGALESLYGEYRDRAADARLIVDTMNLAGRCVVAGGIRRSAQIALGDAHDAQFLDLKLDAEKVREYRWASNNSVIVPPGARYGDIAARTAVNGEPGYLWLDNARRFGRMGDAEDDADEAAMGSNPCMEQTLWDREICCLVETYPAHHATLDDYLATLRVAYLYAKAVTLVPVHDATTASVVARNRRIGCSMTGIVQALDRLGREGLLHWCDRGYRRVRELDREYSRWLAVPGSIKTTSVKPSGTVSLLAGATPGVHWEHAPYYVRRVRVTRDHRLASACRAAGYAVDDDWYAPDTVVIAFPVRVRRADRCKSEVPLREKVELAADLQHWWSDNQVSCTADFDPDTESGELAPLLSEFDTRLKGIVFLPATGHGYRLPPYETITRERYESLCRDLRPLGGELAHEHDLEAAFCEGGTCELP